MRREILKVTKNNNVIRNGLQFHVCNNVFRFKVYSCMHDELINGIVNEKFLDMSIDDVQKTDCKKFNESLTMKFTQLTISEYAGRFDWVNPRPFEYAEDLRNILGLSCNEVMMGIDSLLRDNGFNVHNIPKRANTKFRMNILGNMYPCQDTWNKLIRLNEYYTDTEKYQFDLVQTIKISGKKSYKRTGIILDRYEMISIEEYTREKDGVKYTMIYKTDHRKTHSREFLVLYTGSNIIDVYQFNERGISYTGSPENVIDAYNRYVSETSSDSENDEEGDW